MQQTWGCADSAERAREQGGAGWAGCEPGMSVPVYRNEQSAAGRCPSRRSRNGRGAAGRAALAVPSRQAPAASGKRPQALPSAPRPVRNRHRDRDRNRAGPGAPGRGPRLGLASQWQAVRKRYITAGGSHWLRRAVATPRGGHTLGAVPGTERGPWAGPGPPTGGC